ncbi:MAG: hypothetical protein DHS20C18_27820 [Saprospiraceae bacterium]|nr:MAG: hypothetical protein DHS20C18_27820 [Saprospiraceae bacterium]
MMMINDSKLMTNLSLLNSKDLARFRDFVQSPFFNKHQPTLTLAEYLFDHPKRWKSITKEELFSHLFPGESYAEFKVNNVMSYLMELLNRFLEQIGIEASQEMALHGLVATQERGLIKLFQSNLRKAKKSLAATDGWDEDHYKLHYQFLLLEHDYQKKLEKKYAMHLLKEASSTLDTWYLKQKLERSCELLTLSNLHNEKAEQSLLQPLIAFIEKYQAHFFAIPIIHVFYKCLMAIWYPEQEAHYFELLAFFEKNESDFSYQDRKTVYGHLLNYTTKKTNANHPFFAKETFKIYIRLLDNDFLMNNGTLHQITYNNITSLACNFGLFDWGENFVRSYAPYLPDDARDNAYGFNLANIYFHQERYEEALELVQHVLYTNYFYKQKTKFLQVKIYYEMKEEALLFSALDSFRIFALRTKKIASEQRRWTLNFVKFAKTLASTAALEGVLKKEAFQKKVQQLQAKFDTFKAPILHKDWLRDKIAELGEGVRR